MTKIEFAEVIAKLAVALGTPIAADDATAKQRIDIYFQLLGDLPLDALRLAAEKLVLERKWPSFPQVAELREVAVNIMHRRNSLPDAGEAWDIARKMALTMADESLTYKVVNGERIPTKDWNDRRLSKIPSAVAEALRQFGWQRICDTSNDQIGTAFAQFRTIYEACAAKVREGRLLPDSTRRRMEQLPAAVAKIAGSIGLEKPA